MNQRIAYAIGAGLLIGALPLPLIAESVLAAIAITVLSPYLWKIDG